MSHARSQHPNAPLTPAGRHRMVECVLRQVWTVEATAVRFQVDASAYDGFIHSYNHHRAHGALGWATPTRIIRDNLPEEHT